MITNFFLVYRFNVSNVSKQLITSHKCNYKRVGLIKVIKLSFQIDYETEITLVDIGNYPKWSLAGLLVGHNITVLL